jgi:hypothetical protein
MNNTMVREIRGAKINPKSSFKIMCAKYAGAEITRANTVIDRKAAWLMSSYGIKYILGRYTRYWYELRRVSLHFHFISRKIGRKLIYLFPTM